MSKEKRMPTVFTGMSKHNFYLKDAISNFVLKEHRVPLNPYMLFGYYMGDAIERDFVRKGSHELLLTADELWIFGIIADGIVTEIELAMKHNKPIHFYTMDDTGLDFKEIVNMDDLKFEPEVLPKLPYHDYRRRIEDYLKLNRGNSSGIEIERKWLLTKVPEHLCLLSVGMVEQLYFSGDTDIRIRKVEADGSTLCTMDVKGPGDLERKEIKKNITIDEYNQMKEIIGKKPIDKQYYRYDVGLKNVLEVSVVDPGTKDSFIYAEIEFDSQEAAEAYTLPIQEALDITYTPEYKMKNVWKRSRL